MTKLLRPRFSAKKLSINRMRWNVCDNSSSSSDEDIFPILPHETPLPDSSASSELSTIEESHMEDETSCNSSTSEYMTSNVNDDLTSQSGDDKSVRAQCYRQIHSPPPENYSVVGPVANSFVPNDPPRDEIIEVPSSIVEEDDLDINRYHSSKILAQALMNIALLAANANQLMHLLEHYEDDPLFYAVFGFIITSFVIQFLVKIFLMINFRYNMNIPNEARSAHRINQLITIAILVITLVNIVITGVIMFRR